MQPVAFLPFPHNPTTSNFRAPPSFLAKACCSTTEAAQSKGGREGRRGHGKRVQGPRVGCSTENMTNLMRAAAVLSTCRLPPRTITLPQLSLTCRASKRPSDCKSECFTNVSLSAGVLMLQAQEQTHTLTDVIGPEVRSLLLVWVAGCAVLVPKELHCFILLIIFRRAHLQTEGDAWALINLLCLSNRKLYA